jgi:hypothetical protein
MRNPNVSRGGQLIAFGKSLESAPPLSDADFFAGIEWDESDHARFRRAAIARDFERLAELAVEAAHGRGSQDPAQNLANCSRQSLWSRHQLEESTRAAALIRVWDPRANQADAPRNGTSRGDRELSRDLRTGLDRWAQMCAAGEPLSRLEILLLFEVLRDIGTRMPAPLAAKLWRLGLAAAIQGTRFWEFEKGILDAELCWQAGLIFAPISGAESVATSARAKLGRMLLDSTDSEGVPAAELVEDLPNWLATFLRARDWGRRFSRPLFESQCEKRFQALIGAAARLSLGNGRVAFSNGQANGFAGLWSVAAAAISGRNGFAQHAVRYLDSLGNGSHSPRRPKTSNGTLKRESVRPVFQSDTSRSACLRNKLSPDANSLSVLHHGQFPELELATQGSLLFAGPWEIEVRIANQPVAISGPWKCSCWYSDDEGDYLELQARPSTHLRIERQFFLARNDDWLFLADVVVGPGTERIDYRSRLQLAHDIGVAHDRKTRACRLTRANVPARLFPIGLPFERVQSSPGRLADSQHHVEFLHSGIGGLYAPVVLDWNSARRRRPAIWRALTVAQNGSAVPAAEAAGFRLQVGKEQWLIYRSLSRILEPRTVLGQHTVYETLIGRFSTTGAVEPIVLVEQGTEEAG